MIKPLSTICVLLLCTNVLELAAKNISPASCHPESSECCLTSGCINAATELLQNMDTTLDPCDDFYKFVCNNFIKRTVLPEDKVVEVSFSFISDKVDEQLKGMLEEPVEPNEPKQFAIIKDIYRFCMDEESIEKDNLKSAKAFFKKLGGWPVLDGDSWHEDGYEWTKMFYKFREVGLPTYNFFVLRVDVNTKNSSRRIIKLDEGLLNIPRDYLIEGFDNQQVKWFYDYIVDVAVIFGADRKEAEKQIKDSFEFEIEIAKIQLPKEAKRNHTLLYNLMTISELEEKYPSIPWLEYIRAIIAVPGVEISSDEVIEVSVPKYIGEMGKLLQKTNKRTQANYIMSYIVNNMIDYLTKELKNRQMEYVKVTTGQAAMEPRWKECVAAISQGMKIALSAKYVRKYVPQDARENAKTLVSDLQNAFKNLLKEIDWMDDETRKSALEKTQAMESHIAYPIELLDDNKLNSYFAELEAADNYIESALKGVKFLVGKMNADLRKPVNRSDWTQHSNSVNVNAYYSVQANSIELPAGILQGSIFNKDRPHYMNYGAIGFIIGHEITHGYDDVGRQFNKDGELVDWWAESTKEAYMKKAQCIIDQYSSYLIREVNLTLNGINTQGENIADNGGIKEAYLAYEAWVERNGEELKLPGLNYTPKQLFWISSANVWCSKQKDEYLRNSVYTDNHSPFYFRVIGSFSNSDQFAKDFSCPEGSRMNPVKKCRVW